MPGSGWRARYYSFVWSWFHLEEDFWHAADPPMESLAFRQIIRVISRDFTGTLLVLNFFGLPLVGVGDRMLVTATTTWTL